MPWRWHTTYGTLPDSEHSAQLRKAVIASTIGTTIEWYDFFLYGTAAGLVFGKLYFPNQNPLSATLLAFGTYFIGFVARPVGAAIFGHYGDRIGRKATLIATLLCMGIATFLVAFVPTYALDRHLGRGDPAPCCGRCKASASAANGAGRCCWRWNGRAPTASAGWSPRGRNSAFRPDCSCRIWRCLASAPGRATSSPCGAGAFRSRSRSSWSASACGFGSAFLRRRCSRSF